MDIKEKMGWKMHGKLEKRLDDVRDETRCIHVTDGKVYEVQLGRKINLYSSQTS